MSGRTAPSSRSAAPAVVSIDVVLVTYRDHELYVYAEPEKKPPGLSLPWGTPARGEPLDAVAARIAKRALGVVPHWIRQTGAFADSSTHPAGSSLSVCYGGVTPWVENECWKAIRPLSAFGARQRVMVTSTLTMMRSHIEQSPVAFSLLPRDFTLSELQQAYETVLGRRLHKASFRRALQAAYLVEPTRAWRSEGRGRPAQLFRYAPRKRRSVRRGVRLDLL